MFFLDGIRNLGPAAKSIILSWYWGAQAAANPPLRADRRDRRGDRRFRTSCVSIRRTGSWVCAVKTTLRVTLVVRIHGILRSAAVWHLRGLREILRWVGSFLTDLVYGPLFGVVIWEKNRSLPDAGKWFIFWSLVGARWPVDAESSAFVLICIWIPCITWKILSYRKHSGPDSDIFLCEILGKKRGGCAVNRDMKQSASDRFSLC